MHPYECGILGVKALDFYPLFDCADCSHCACCCGGFCGSTGINCSHRTWVASGLSDSSIAHNGTHRIKQAHGYPSRAVASAIEEDFAATTDAGLSCIHRCFGDRRRMVEFAQFKQLVSSPGTAGKGIKANN
jgi:hypothetical protein